MTQERFPVFKNEDSIANVLSVRLVRNENNDVDSLRLAVGLGTTDMHLRSWSWRIGHLDPSTLEDMKATVSELLYYWLLGNVGVAEELNLRP